MKLTSLGEFGLIRAIQKLSPRSTPDISIGIGDDAAVLSLSTSQQLLATTDLLIEGVHFDLALTDFQSLGWKSAAVNLSDIAAMGGVPKYCLVSLGLPKHLSLENITEFYKGLTGLLRIHKVGLVGGDTCASDKGVLISVTILGVARKGTVVPRSGARTGDRIYVTGTLGDSAAGLELLQSGRKGRGARVKDGNKLIERHLRPTPRVEWGRKIALTRCASAMIDISDGLSSDLAHICEASGVGATIYRERMPYSSSLRGAVELLSRPSWDYASSGGEDYELLFTVPLSRRESLKSLRIPLTDIGMVTTKRTMVLVDAAGNTSQLKPGGYDHFRSSRTSITAPGKRARRNNP